MSEMEPEDFKLLADLTDEDLKTVTQEQLAQGIALRFLDFTVGVSEDLKVLARYSSAQYATLDLPDLMANATRQVAQGKAWVDRWIATHAQAELLHDYMAYRAIQEQQPYDLDVPFFERALKSGIRRFFGVSVGDTGLIAHEQNPETLREWWHARRQS